MPQLKIVCVVALVDKCTVFLSMDAFQSINQSMDRSLFNLGEQLFQGGLRLRLWRLALARPAQADAGGAALRLAVSSTCGLCRAEEEFARREVFFRAGAAIAVAVARMSTYCLACPLAERFAEVASRGKQGAEVVEADWPLGAVARPIRIADAWCLSQHDAACSASPVAKCTPESSIGQRYQRYNGKQRQNKLGIHFDFYLL